MKKTRKAQGTGDAETHRYRVKPMRTIKIAILQGIDDVESGQPENNCNTKKQRYYQLAWLKQ
jgi:hypothetical protein